MKADDEEIDIREILGERASAKGGHYPVPEALEGGETWKVEPGFGKEPKVDVLAKAMTVPVGEECRCGLDHERASRAHALTAAAFGEPAKDAFEAAAEKLRINHVMEAEGFEHPGLWHAEDVRSRLLNSMRTLRPDNMVGAIAEMTGTGDIELVEALQQEMAKTIQKAPRGSTEQAEGLRMAQWLRQARNVSQMAKERYEASGAIPDTMAREQAAGWLRQVAKYLAEDAKALRKEREEQDKGGKSKEPGGGEEPPIGTGLQDTQFWAEEVEEGEATTRGSRLPFIDDALAQWGTMNIIEHRMGVRHREKHGKRWRPSETGPVPRYLHLKAGSDAVFASKRRAPGGTVLIDCSGSMEWDAQDIADCVEQAPGATIACYSGNSDTGTLHIFAKKGRRSTAAYISGIAEMMPPSNVIDGPALEWLARQAEPRIWISDGGVTGVADSQSAGLLIHADSIVKRGRIVMLPKTTQAAKALRALRRRR